MKRNLFSVFALFLIALIVSCAPPEVQDGPGRAIISIDNRVRGISPLDMDVAKYSVNIKNTAKSFDKTLEVAKNAGQIIESVPSGNVTVTVTALNKDGVSIGSGSVTKTVVPGADTSFRINVLEFTGDGTLSVAVPSGYAPLDLEIYIKGDSGFALLEKVSFSVDTTGAKVEKALANGFYLLKFKADGKEIAPFETVRIVSGHTSSLALTAEDFNIGTLNITFSIKEKLPSDADHLTLKIENSFRNYTSSVNYGIKDNLPSAITVPSGNNRVSVEAFTVDGKCLASTGSVIVNVPNGQSGNAALEMLVLKNKGTIDFAVNSQVEFTDLEARVFKAGTDLRVGTVQLSNETGSYKGSLRIEPDFYDIVFADETTVFAEKKNIRVYSSQKTVVNADVADSWHIDVNIVDEIQGNIRIVFSGQKAEYTFGEAYSITAVVEGMKNPLLTWYFDDMPVDNANTLALSGNIPPETICPEGKHTISLVAVENDVIWSEGFDVNITKAEPVMYYLPQFSNAYDVSASKRSTRGLNSIVTPQGPFNGDFYMAGAVMSSMPVMTGVYSIMDDNLKVQLEKDPVELEFRAYGIKLRPQINIDTPKGKRSACRINQDGIFLRYDVLEEIIVDGVKTDSVVGYVDYYYNVLNNTFSYRQYLVNTLKVQTPNGVVNNNGILVLEVLDAPLEADSGDYELGVLDSSGKLSRGLIRDWITLGDDINTFDHGGELITTEGYCSFARSYPTVSSRNGEIVSFSSSQNTYRSPWIRTHEVPYFADAVRLHSAPATPTDRADKNYPGIEDYVINSENSDSLDINFLVDVFSVLYDKGSAILKTDVRRNPEAVTYISQEEFDRHSIGELGRNNPFADKLHSTTDAINQNAVFDLKTRKGASFSNLLDFAYDNYSSIDAAVKYFSLVSEPDKSKWAGTPVETAPHPEYVEQLIRKLLHHSGITDENFIRNYTWWTIHQNLIFNKLGDAEIPEELFFDTRAHDDYKAAIAHFLNDEKIYSVNLVTPPEYESLDPEVKAVRFEFTVENADHGISYTRKVDSADSKNIYFNLPSGNTTISVKGWNSSNVEVLEGVSDTASAGAGSAIDIALNCLIEKGSIWVDAESLDACTRMEISITPEGNSSPSAKVPMTLSELNNSLYYYESELAPGNYKVTVYVDGKASPMATDVVATVSTGKKTKLGYVLSSKVYPLTIQLASGIQIPPNLTGAKIIVENVKCGYFREFVFQNAPIVVSDCPGRVNVRFAAFTAEGRAPYTDFKYALEPMKTPLCEITPVAEEAYDTRFFITTAGQSTSSSQLAQMINLGKYFVPGKDFLRDDEPIPRLAQITYGDYGAVVFSLGSMDGHLEEYGISITEELKYIKQAIDTAKSRNIKVIAEMHLPHLRRPEWPDCGIERIIDLVVSNSDFVIIASACDSDNKFTNICAQNNIPLHKDENLRLFSQKWGQWFWPVGSFPAK